jgi:hypothetical protein
VIGQNSQYLPPFGAGGQSVQQGGAQQIQFRDPLDAARSGMSGFVPDAAYPSGYLGTIQSRREDRFLQNLQGQVNERSYSRGVHKGERIDPSDYFWPSEMQPQAGLVRQMQTAVPQPDGTIATLRFAPMMTVQEQMLASGGEQIPMTPRGKMRPPPTVYDVNPDVAASLRRYAPSWK